MFEKIQDQFKKPKGLTGKVVGKMMAKDNKTLNSWTIRQLKIRAGNNILEVGYGPGYGIYYILHQYPNAHVDGIDLSETMKKEASQRLDTEINANKVRLFDGDIVQASFQQNYYHRVFAVNNYTLWQNKAEGLRNIYESMATNGKLAITMQPRQEDANASQAQVFAKQIQDDLQACGFVRIKTRYKKISPEMAVCVTAIKPGNKS